MASPHIAGSSTLPFSTTPTAGNPATSTNLTALPSGRLTTLTVTLTVYPFPTTSVIGLPSGKQITIPITFPETTVTGTTVVALPVQSQITTITNTITIAATNPSATTITGSKPTSSYSGLQAGAVAGISIGCAAAGALVAALVLLLCMARRQKSRSHHDSGTTLSKGYALSDRPQLKHEDDSISQGNSEQLDLILPQPLTDDSVKHEVKSLFAIIEQHVENFYHERPFHDSIDADYNKHQRKQLPAGILTQDHVEFGELLADPTSRLSAISCLICSEMLDSINIIGDPGKSLLPPVVTYFLRSIPAQNEPSRGAYELSLSRWRVSTSLLRGPQGNPEEQAYRDRSIQAIIKDLDSMLGPFIVQEHAKQRQADLVALCKRAHKLGVTLFSQPAHWEFQWRRESNQPSVVERNKFRGLRTSLVIFPGLWRLTDNMSKRLGRPLSLLEPKLSRQG